MMLTRICVCALASLSLWGAPSDAVASAAPFEFHSNFWINLHHFLYQQAMEESRGRAKPEGDAAWNDAVQFYKTNVIGRDLLFDRGMNRIDTALASADSPLRDDTAALDKNLRTILNAAAPIYRARWWPAHDRANRFWIRATVPLVDELSARLTQQIATAYEVQWPAAPVRVDVAVYANWAGAYTWGTNPIHTLASSTNAGYQGFAALEMLFHEASHGLVGEPGGRLVDAIARECKAADIPVPDDLLHVFIFYTAGELARRDLAEYGVTGYEPYASKNGLYARAGWTRYEEALDLFWKPHLDGALSLDEAVGKVVQALAATGRRTLP
jgi:hypothetical protein